MAGKSRARVTMIDVGRKNVTERKAVARGFVRLSPSAIKKIRAGTLQKGDVLQAAQLAGIMAAKRTPDLLPLCHPVRLTHAAVDLTVADSGVAVVASVRARDRTGVEMEALTAVSAAALTIYDMCKSVDRKAVIEGICLMKKSGGRSGRWVRADGVKEK